LVMIRLAEAGTVDAEFQTCSPESLARSERFLKKS